MLNRAGTIFVAGAIVVGVVLDATISAIIDCNEPRWATLIAASSPSCAEFWLNRYQGLLGAGTTLLAGWLAYRAAMIAAALAESRAKKTEIAVLTEKIARAMLELDNLKLAPAYLDNIANQFPPDNQPDGAFVVRLRGLRFKARDILSYSAANAPAPHGSRVETVVGRLRSLGDSVQEMDMRGVSIAGIATLIGADVRNAIAGLGDLAMTIRNDLPRADRQLVALMDERDALLK